MKRINIIGINAIGYNTSACLIQNGKLINAVEEERLTREKRTRKFPINAINFLLKNNNLKINDIDHLAVSWNPGINLEKFDKNISENVSYIPDILHSIPNNILRLSSGDESILLKQQILTKKIKALKISYINHHLSHASNFLFSPFKKSSILSFDAFGENQSCGMYYGENNKIKKIYEINFPHSLGSFYSTFTEICGFKPQSDEWKLMGASAYGNLEKFYKKIKKLIILQKDGKFELNLKYFNHYMFHRPKFYNQNLLDYLNINVNNSNNVSKIYFDLARAVQQVFEETLFYMLNNLYKKTKNSNLVLSGGCALNSLANGKIINNTKFKNIFICPAPDDSGAGVGAAFWVYNNIMNKKRVYVLENNYLGPEYSNNYIKKKLIDYKVNYEYVKSPSKKGAELIANGKIIGWFQGKMEFGDRALGNRSILADPRLKNIKDRINKTVKYRETFRPFAPSILDNRVKDFFENYQDSKFMEKTIKVKKNKRKILPGVTHCDYTARLQTVKKNNNPLFYNLIDEFDKITNVPIVINTSLNYKGDPMCCSVDDALHTFYLSGLDNIIIGNFLISK